MPLGKKRTLHTLIRNICGPIFITIQFDILSSKGMKVGVEEGNTKAAAEVPKINGTVYCSPIRLP